VDQSINHGSRDDRIAEDLAPGGERLVGRHDRRGRDGAAVLWPGPRAGERRIAELEQLVGKKEVEPAPRPEAQVRVQGLAETALLKNFLGQNG
jgi:hypothetical protein